MATQLVKRRKTKQSRCSDVDINANTCGSDALSHGRSRDINTPSVPGHGHRMGLNLKAGAHLSLSSADALILPPGKLGQPGVSKKKSAKNSRKMKRKYAGTPVVAALGVSTGIVDTVVRGTTDDSCNGGTVDAAHDEKTGKAAQTREEKKKNKKKIKVQKDKVAQSKRKHSHEDGSGERFTTAVATGVSPRKHDAKSKDNGSATKHSISVGGAALRVCVPPAGPLNHPFPTDPGDHCETPLQAYRDIEPVLAALANALGKTKATLRILDPFYCDGAARRHLHTLGFVSARNDNADWYERLRTGTVPEHDVLLTNPPYSGGHLRRILEHVAGSSKPALLLLPRCECAAVRLSGAL